MSDPKFTSAINLPDVNVHELVEALNDIHKARSLMEKHGWTREDLLKRADLVAKQIAAGISNVAVV